MFPSIVFVKSISLFSRLYFCSTPFRPQAPSLREELIQSGMSPFPGDSGSLCMEINGSVMREPQHLHRGDEDFSSALAKAVCCHSMHYSEHAVVYIALVNYNDSCLNFDFNYFT